MTDPHDRDPKPPKPKTLPEKVIDLINEHGEATQADGTQLERFKAFAATAAYQLVASAVEDNAGPIIQAFAEKEFFKIGFPLESESVRFLLTHFNIDLDAVAAEHRQLERERRTSPDGSEKTSGPRPPGRYPDSGGNVGEA